MSKKLLLLITLMISSSLLPILISAECTCDNDAAREGKNRIEALKYKFVAVVTILIAGAIGVSLPILGKIFPVFSPETDVFFFIKAFAAGVILATGMVHVLPDAFESLTNPCLNENPWGNFPFSGFVAMLSAIGTLMVDTFATSYYKRCHFNKPKPIDGGDEEGGGEHTGHLHLHTHTTHGHSHVSTDDSVPLYLIRHRIVSQVHTILNTNSLSLSIFKKIVENILNCSFFLMLLRYSFTINFCLNFLIKK